MTSARSATSTGSRAAWPIAYADFEPYYTRAEQLYHVHGERKVDPLEPRRPGRSRYPAISHEPRIEQLSADLRVRRPPPVPAAVGIMIDEDEPVHSPCIRCDTCDGFPCMVNAQGRRPGRLRRTGAAATRTSRCAPTPTSPGSRPTGDGRTVTEVVVERDGEHEEYTADVVVVSAGAINSAALLLRSANEQHPDGLGNGSGVVGRNLMLHNNSSLIAFSKIPNPTMFQKTLGINDFYYGDPDGDWDFPLGAMQMLGSSDADTDRLRRPKDAADPAELARHAARLLDDDRGPARWPTTASRSTPTARISLALHARRTSKPTSA